MISARSPPSLVPGSLVLKGFQKDRPILLRYSGNPMVRAAPPVGPARVRLLPGRQRDDDLRRAPWRYQDGAPTIIAHPATASKVGFTGRTPRPFCLDILCPVHFTFSVYLSRSSEARCWAGSLLSLQLPQATGLERTSGSSGSIEVDKFTFLNSNDQS
jgi:hypothetical protein